MLTWPSLPRPLFLIVCILRSAFCSAFCYRDHLQRLCQLVTDGQLAVVLDPHRFVGLSEVPAAVDLLQSGNSSGKVVVQLSNRLPDAPAAARL